MNLPDNASDNALAHAVTSATATGAAVSPLWLHNLSDLSQTLLPILGVIVLLIQGAAYLYKTFIRKPKA
jgi:hypothetical protein